MQTQPTLRSTRLLTAPLISLLFFGTLMPGSWKHSAERIVGGPLGWALGLVLHGRAGRS